MKLRPLCVLVMFTALGFGCASILQSDFEKATLLSSVDLGLPSQSSRLLKLPPGSAQVVIAIPGAHCQKPDMGASVNVRFKANKHLDATVAMKLSQLTWSYAEGSCDAYGYLYDVSAGTSPTVEIAADTNEASVDIEVHANGPARLANVWLIYGGRAPTSRLFGAR